MQFSGDQALPVAKAEAFKALNDLDMLKAALPGCESITPLGQDAFEVIVSASVGPVKARFKGKMRLADIVVPDSYTIHFDGQGGVAGHAKGNAKVRLDDLGGTTRVSYTAEVQVGGKLAQLGSRLIDMAAHKMTADFFERFQVLLSERYPGLSPSGRGWWARIVAWVRKLLGR